MSGKILLSQSVFLSLASLLAIQLCWAAFLPHHDETFCHGRLNGDYEYPAPNCSFYYSCVDGYTYVRQCAPSDLYYRQEENKCDWPWTFPQDKQDDCRGIPAEDRTTSTPASTITTELKPEEPTDLLPTPSSDPFCEDKPDGMYEYPSDCGKFYHCSNQLTYIKDCPDNLYFNQTEEACEHPDSFPQEIQDLCRGLTTADYSFVKNEQYEKDN